MITRACRAPASLRTQVAIEAYGHSVGSEALANALEDDIGECVRDASAFICHPFARSEEVKKQLGKLVARRSRAHLDKLLADRGSSYRTVEDVRRGPALGATRPSVGR
jgi:predicted alpha/beta-fold hydrolase